MFIEVDLEHICHTCGRALNAEEISVGTVEVESCKSCTNKIQDTSVLQKKPFKQEEYKNKLFHAFEEIIKDNTSGELKYKLLSVIDLERIIWTDID